MPRRNDMFYAAAQLLVLRRGAITCFMPGRNITINRNKISLDLGRMHNVVQIPGSTSLGSSKLLIKSVLMKYNIKLKELK